MWVLRLVLVTLGTIFVVGLYFYTRRHPPRAAPEPKERRDPAATAPRAREAAERTSPVGGAASATTDMDWPVEPPREANVASSADAKSVSPDSAPQIFSLAVRLPGEGVRACIVTAALSKLGCAPGADGIFHARGKGDGDAAQAPYSIASLFEPGLLHPLPSEEPVRGLVFFFRATPGRDASERFDRMLGATRECARRLAGRIEDQAHRPLTAARVFEIKLAAAGSRSSA